MKQCYYYIYKPYGTVTRFTSDVPSHKTLKQVYNFPSNVYSVGRLDKDSEGLLILTNDSSFNSQLLVPEKKHARTYYVQVEGTPAGASLNRLMKGVDIRVNKKPYKTITCLAEFASDLDWIKPRVPSIRERKNIPTTWLKLILYEGKNRQVRKMCAAIGYPVLRLIRSEIELLSVKNFKVGEVKEIDRESLLKYLKIDL